MRERIKWLLWAAAVVAGWGAGSAWGIAGERREDIGVGCASEESGWRSGGVSGLQAEDDAARVERLADLCELWGKIKLHHPWMASREIDWDRALLEALEMFEKSGGADTAEEYRAVVGKLIEPLYDPVTRVIEPEKTGYASGREANAGVTACSVVREAIDGKPYCMIDATNWGFNGQGAYAQGGPFGIAFGQAANTDGMILDLRRFGNTPAPESDWAAYGYAMHLRADLRTLIGEDLRISARRWRVHSGFASQGGFSSGGHFSGFLTAEMETARPAESTVGARNIVILTNPGTRGVTDILASLQAKDWAVVVHETRDLSGFENDLAAGMELEFGTIVRYRTQEMISADGTLGFCPNEFVEASASRENDPAMARARAIVSGAVKRPGRTILPGSSAAGVAKAEQAYPEARGGMTKPMRLLALFRYWTILEAFFPYKEHLDTAWERVLRESIPRFEEAETFEAYARELFRLSARTNDSHSGVYASDFPVRDMVLGGFTAPVKLGWVEGKLVVRELLEPKAEGIAVGEVIVSIDGTDATKKLEEVGELVAWSTAQALRFSGTPLVLAGAEGTRVKVAVEGVDGARREMELERKTRVGQAYTWGDNPAYPSFTVLESGFAYFNLTTLKPEEVTAAFAAAGSAPGLILDMRGYPNGTAWGIGGRLTEKRVAAAKFWRPRLEGPVEEMNDRYEFIQWIDPVEGPARFTGPVAVLINERAISQSEHSCLIFAACAPGRITFVGTETQGANGDVTAFALPGGLGAVFTGHNVSHADGRQLQRVGIRPDVRVEPTLAGVREGKDEVLDAAVAHLKKAIGP